MTLREYAQKSLTWFIGQVILDIFIRGWKERGKEMKEACAVFAWLCAFVVIILTSPIAVPILAYRRMKYWRLKYKNYPFKKEV